MLLMEGPGIGVTRDGVAVGIEIRADPIGAIVVGDVGRVIHIIAIANGVVFYVRRSRKPAIVLPTAAVPFLQPAAIDLDITYNKFCCCGK